MHLLLLLLLWLMHWRQSYLLLLHGHGLMGLQRKRLLWFDGNRLLGSNGNLLMLLLLLLMLIHLLLLLSELLML